MYVVDMVHHCIFLASYIVWVVVPWWSVLLKRPPSWMWSNLSLIITSTWWRFKTYFTINMPLGHDGSGISLHHSILKYWNLYLLYNHFAKEIPKWWYQQNQVVCLSDLFTIWLQKNEKILNYQNVACPSGLDKCLTRTDTNVYLWTPSRIQNTEKAWIPWNISLLSS